MHQVIAAIAAVFAVGLLLSPPDESVPKQVTSYTLVKPTLAPTPTPTPMPVRKPVRTPTRKTVHIASVSEDTSGPTRTVHSTCYCLRGTMANGSPTHHGAVAMNGVEMGTQWRVLSGPHQGRVLVVSDRIGHGSEFDIWIPDCQAALRYGRQTITVQRLT